MVSVINGLTLPGAIPSFSAIAICWGFHLSGLDSLWVAAPLVGITFLGGAYIGSVFIAELWRRFTESRKTGS